MMRDLVTIVSLALSFASFVTFVVFGATGLRKSLVHRPASQSVDVQLQAGLSDIAKIAEAFAKPAESLGKFAESLAKAGPAIAALVASIIFLLVAWPLSHGDQIHVTRVARHIAWASPELCSVLSFSVKHPSLR
jgi:hypothetical protein